MRKLLGSLARRAVKTANANLTKSVDTPEQRPRKGRLRNTDHGFASGGVFPRPRDLEHALELTGRSDEAGLLIEVWEQFLTNGLVHESVLLGVNARMLNDHPDQAKLTVRAHSVLRGMLRQEADGTIEVGSYVYIGDNSILHSMQEISIGDETLIAHNVNVLDNDTHPIGSDERAAHFRRLLGMQPPVPFEIERAPISIGRRCWIGLNTVVLKGVTIGDETIVSAGSVVTKSLPPKVLAAGVPAQPVKSL